MNALEALDRARVAWERTSPQLVIDGWLDMLDGLDEPQSSALRFVEPAVSEAIPVPSPAAGSTQRLRRRPQAHPESRGRRQIGA